MITDSEKFVEIQGILVKSNISILDLRKINDLIIELSTENRELKKRLEEIDYTVIPNSDIKPLIDRYKIQQEIFIKYLEKDSNEIYRDVGLRQNIFRQILQKYKQIIGVLDGKEN